MLREIPLAPRATGALLWGVPAERLRARTTIFTKRPEPGRVKTRLEPLLGPEGAAELAQAMLDDTIAKCAREQAFESGLCVTPPASVSWFRARYPAIASVDVQVGPDLGERLARHVERELAGDLRSLVVIGSDAPHVDTQVIVEAHERLARGADVVLGLDDGGGYHLIAMSRAHTRLLRDVPMSTADMGQRTIDLARALGLALELTSSSFDIDVPADVERLVRLAGEDPALRARIPRTLACLRR